jgi:NAD(P)-dependent dehydrogenase (short-subunit alcohol dehydrogenase family)
MRLAGKAALIVGGTTGIGLATARLMIAEGARVAICGQEAERLREASTALGVQAKICRADLRSIPDIRRLAEDVGHWTDQLDILFLNAGISRPAEFNTVDEAFFEDHITINIKGPFFVFQQLLGLLGPNASVVITTSCLDEMGRPRMSVYAATKQRFGPLCEAWAPSWSNAASVSMRWLPDRSILAFTQEWGFRGAR